MIRIPVWSRGQVVGHALLDEADAGLASLRWHFHKGYAARKSSGRRVWMHRIVLGLAPDDPRVSDHINHDRLDNRRGNLRAVSNSENQQNRVGVQANNSTGYRGVAKGKNGRFRAFVSRNGKPVYIGNFADPAQAAAVAAEARRAAGYLEPTPAPTASQEAA